MKRILIVEDDKSLHDELCTLLKVNGYATVDEPPYDLAILDVMLGDKNGFELCRKIKSEYNVPVIFLTAKTDTADELLGFDSGADDYIKKPYNPSVLLARVARLLKRTSVLQARDIKLDCAALTLYYRDQSVVLTKNEMRIMYCLMQNEVCTKDDIIENLWLNSCYIDENTLYVNISRLRDKLKKLGAEGYIRSVRGVGYSL